MEDKQNAIVMMLVYVAFIILFETLAQHSFKLCHSEGNFYKYLLGVMFYGLVGFFLIKAYEYRSMGMINVLWSSLSVLSVMLLSYFYWEEKITYNDIIGTALVILGLFFIMVDDSAFCITAESEKD